MNTKLLIALPALLLAANLHAQQSQHFSIPRAAVANETTMRDDWNPVLQVIEMPSTNSEREDAELQELKEQLAVKYATKKKPAQLRLGAPSSTSVTPAAPTIGRNMQGNGFANSTPNDNEISISNEGKILSVQNTNMFRYDDANSAPLGAISLNSWATALSNFQSKFDPKVIYDPLNDRYIMLCLAGFTDSTSSILVGFSQTNAPNGAWNLYELPGNPFNDTLWTDYPAVGMTKDEVFITVNLLHNNMTWQAGFVQSLIWQINKNSGYSGGTLNTQLHSGIQTNGRNVRNLCPVKGGSTLYGPDMYFLSDRNLDASNDTVFLIHLTDTINAPGQQLTVQVLTTNLSYGAPPDAHQGGTTDLLATNDARMLGAFIENDRIQYVHTTLDTSTGNASVYHGIIDNVSSAPAVTGHIFSDTLEFGYPNIAYAGKGPAGDTAIIGFLHTNSSVFPGVSAVLYDGSNYSTRTVTKTGLGYINLLSGTDRWGDYTGMQRRYNSPGTVWMNGMYGISNHTHSTWITELGSSADVGINAPQQPATEVNVFPNPFAETVEVTFTADREEQLEFAVYDVNGRLVKLLLRERVIPGVNRFSFSTGALAKGTYFLKITSPGKVFVTKKIVKQ